MPNKNNCGFAIRLHVGKMRKEQWKTPAGKPFTLLNLPCYLTGRIPQYAEWLVGGIQNSN